MVGGGSAVGTQPSYAQIVARCCDAAMASECEAPFPGSGMQLRVAAFGANPPGWPIRTTPVRGRGTEVEGLNQGRGRGWRSGPGRRVLYHEGTIYWTSELGLRGI